METLIDYFDCSLFNHAISRPLEYDGLLEKDGATKGIDTYSIENSLRVSQVPDGILVDGEKSQYWLGRNVSVDDNLRDNYDYEAKITKYNDSVCVEVNADIDRYVGSSYWDIINLPTYQIATIPKENGRYHISFEEYYYLKDGVLVHNTSLSDKVEVYMVPEEFKLGDSFKDSQSFVFDQVTMQEGIKKIKEFPQGDLETKK